MGLGFVNELCRNCANEKYFCEWLELGSSSKKKKLHKRLIVISSFLLFVIRRESKQKLKVCYRSPTQRNATQRNATQMTERLTSH
jgi:hypothetical protein